MGDASPNDSNHVANNTQPEMTLFIGSRDEESFLEPVFLHKSHAVLSQSENTDPLANCCRFNYYNNITSPSNEAKLDRIEHFCPQLRDTKEIMVSSGTSAVKDVKKARENIINFIQDRLKDLITHYHEDLSELSFIHSGSLLIDLYKWRQAKPYDLMLALRSGHLDEEDLKAVEDFVSGKISHENFFPLSEYSSIKTKNQMCSLNAIGDPESDDDDDDRYLDEAKIMRLAEEEVSVLKRISELKNLGLWSLDALGENLPGADAPSMSALAPPNEPELQRTHSSYLFAELRWLAEDYARERQWKKASAKKLAYAALKAYREKTERSFKAEREETMRTRKMCAFIARMVRDWWRQMDKIVHAKHQVRLAAKRQKAMSSHLGRVLETTEQYTRWLTEGMGVNGPCSRTSGTNCEFAHESQTLATDSPDKGQGGLNDPVFEGEIDNGPITDVSKSSSFVVPAGTSDKEDTSDQDSTSESDENSSQEFQADDSDIDSAELDDEETIAKEEELAAREEALASQSNDCKISDQSESRAEIEQLALEAMQPIEDLIPPGYLEALTAEGGGSSGLGSLEESTPVSLVSLSPSGEDRPTPCSDFAPSQSLDKPAVSPMLTHLAKQPQDQIPQQIYSDTPNQDTKNEEPVVPTLVNSSEQKADVLRSLTAEAMSAQPSDITLASPTVPPPVPFLLTGTLREYQLVGLGWLSAIYTKRLNGILADEMGLGKTIQTIALLAHLACDQAVWGPHLIVVPTSVMLNWEMEFKRWCPGFKIITYFGSLRERKEKRKGWTKTNAFHVCITSYRLAIQDSAAFKRKKWKYLILDEAQNIKNFKSQRWQTLLTFNSQRRLLLTGTPLQNNLMELWSLMHFLMPNIFQSHREFQEWFASPLTGMIEGNNEYNEQLVRRLHKVLRPFLLRRLKADVERQLPKKYEHIVMCRLSRRQRFLYDDFMSLASTRETLQSGQFLSVMNILMQLRKVCNHPNLFEPRPIISPFHVAPGMIRFTLPRLLADASAAFLATAGLSTSLDAPGPLFSQAYFYGNALPFQRHSATGSVSNNSNSDNITTGVSIAGPSAKAWSAWRLVDQVDWLDRAGAASRLLGQTQCLAEMARYLPGFVARRCAGRLRARPGLITMVDERIVKDEVQNLRARLPLFDFSKLNFRDSDVLNKRKLSISREQFGFFTRSMVAEVNEKYAQKAQNGYDLSSADARFVQPFPNLPPSVPIRPILVEAPPPLRPWNGGVPKSVLRNREAQRRACLSRLAQLNERRCSLLVYSLTSPSSTLTSPQNRLVPTDNALHLTVTPNASEPQDTLFLSNSSSLLGFGDWDTACQLGPDLIHFITRLLNQPLLEPKPCVTNHLDSQLVAGKRQLSEPRAFVRSFASLACRRSLAWWPGACQELAADGRVAESSGFIKPTIIDLASGFNGPVELLPPSLSSSHFPPLRQPPVTGRPSLAKTASRDSSVRKHGLEHRGLVRSGPSHQLSSQLGPEAPLAPRWLWRQDCYPLRGLIASPIDRLVQLEETISRFIFVVPPAISSGVGLDVSSPTYTRENHISDSCLQRILASVLPPPCRPPTPLSLPSSTPALSATGPGRPTASIATAAGSISLASGSGRPEASLSEVGLSSSGGDSNSNQAEDSNQMIVSAEHGQHKVELERTGPVISINAWLMPAQLHSIINKCRFQFPDPRLIQYDCGKLQRLDMLLRELKAGQHRVLIFTQMARMLDILEQFLAYHGYRYLRLDGTTKVEHRQLLMERFNADSRIFVFILSTRSGGLGVNLTGADTVIFYDSDWNPTMDAQAQDRCHRIGQTRDVHIYRLISEMTVEENILRKANQKRFLSDVAIEGGKFTTAFFRQNTINELFAKPSGLEDLAEQKQRELRDSEDRRVTGQAAEIQSVPLAVHNKVIRSGNDLKSTGEMSVLGDGPGAATVEGTPQTIRRGSSNLVSGFSEAQLVAALAACEEESDAVATNRALAEAKAELDEFDETVPLVQEQTGALTVVTTSAPTTETADSEEPSVLGGSSSDPLARFAAARLRQQVLGQSLDSNNSLNKSDEITLTSAPTKTGDTDCCPGNSETTVAADATASISATLQPVVNAHEDSDNDAAAEAAAERGLISFDAQLRPIERFGVNKAESNREESLADELEMADAHLEASKQAWRLEQLKALHEAGAELDEFEEDEMLYCHGAYEPTAQLAELNRLERLERLEAAQAASDAAARVARHGKSGRAGQESRADLANGARSLASDSRFYRLARDKRTSFDKIKRDETNRSLAGRGRPTNASRLSAVAANDTENCENSASFVPKRLKRHPQITGYTSPSEQDADGRAISLSGLSNHDNGEELSPDGSWNDWPSGEKRLAMDRNYSRRNDTLGDEDFYDEQAGHAEDAEEEEDYLYYRGESLASRGPVHISRENQRSGPPGTIHRSRGRPSSIQRHVGHRPAPPILQTDRQRDLAVPNVRNSASSSGGLSRRPVQQRDRPQHWGKRRSTGGGSSEDEVDGVDSIAYDRSARLSCIDEEGGADSEFSSFFASQAYGRGGCYVASRSGRISMPRFADDEDHIYYFYGGAKRLPQQQVSTQKVGSGAPMNQRPSCTGRTLSNSGMAGSSLAGQQKRARYPVIDDSDADWTTGSGANSRSVVGSCGSVARRGQSSSQTFVGQDEEIRSTSAGLGMHRVAEHHLGQPPAQRRMQQQQLKHAYLPPHPAPSQQATSGQTQLQNHRGLQVQQQRSHSSEQLLLSFPNAKSSREGTGLDFTHSHSGQHTKLIINSSGSTSQAAIYTQPSRFFTERNVFSPTKMATSVVTTAASQGNGLSGNEFRSGYSTWSGQEPTPQSVEPILLSLTNERLSAHSYRPTGERKSIYPHLVVCSAASTTSAAAISSSRFSQSSNSRDRATFSPTRTAASVAAAIVAAAAFPDCRSGEGFSTGRYRPSGSPVTSSWTGQLSGNSQDTPIQSRILIPPASCPGTSTQLHPVSSVSRPTLVTETATMNLASHKAPSTSAYGQSSVGLLCPTSRAKFVSIAPPLASRAASSSASGSLLSRHANKPLPNLQLPAELSLPVQSMVNGQRQSLPAKHLLTTGGQPVFVITRQMKMSSGEVYQQRFTQPIQPPDQFIRVVDRLQARPNSHLVFPTSNLDSVVSPSSSSSTISFAPPSSSTTVSSTSPYAHGAIPHSTITFSNRTGALTTSPSPSSFMPSFSSSSSTVSHSNLVSSAVRSASPMRSVTVLGQTRCNPATVIALTPIGQSASSRSVYSPQLVRLNSPRLLPVVRPCLPSAIIRTSPTTIPTVGSHIVPTTWTGPSAVARPQCISQLQMAPWLHLNASTADVEMKSPIILSSAGPAESDKPATWRPSGGLDVNRPLPRRILVTCLPSSSTVASSPSSSSSPLITARLGQTVVESLGAEQLVDSDSQTNCN